MNKADFQKLIKSHGYSCKEEGDQLIIDYKGSIYIGDCYDSSNKYVKVTEIPENVVFRTTGAANAYVQIPSVLKLPLSTVFENTGDVYLHAKVEIPKGFKGFKNAGNITPENFKYKKPKPYYYLSGFFHNFLTEINRDKKNKVSSFIFANLYNKAVNPDLLNATYIDCSADKSEMISYLSADKIIKQYIAYRKESEEKKPGGLVPTFMQWCQQNTESFYNSSERSRVKIGRFLKKIMPDITDKEIEEFVNKYKTMKTIDDYEFVIMRGNDIHKCYDRAYQDCGSGSVLYGSCRNYTEKTDVKYKYCDFYASTPETCGLLVIKYKGEEKIRGRAFIWNTADGKVFVDYAYTSTAVEANLYREYIKKNGYLSGVTKGIVINVNPACRALNPQIPYLDSFQYRKDNDTLTSKY